ncbi:DNA polymerase I [Candidatus Uhrbacteria bacterium]|nr:DNA polymerase I [Candidatus Uhrbacteria bacterium]
MKKETLYILDGNAILHRAWHALPPLATKDGMLVNAAYGFLLVLLKLLRDEMPTYLVATFDKAGPTFRHETYEAYKATRVKAPDELYAQLPVLHEVLGALKIPIFEAAGYEADDLIGTIATKTAKRGVDTVIVTGDLDTLQLVGPHVRVYTFARGIKDTQTYDERAVRARYGLTPGELIDYKALRGDPSDNIKGVHGVGEKTATELIQQFGSIETLYAALKKKSPQAKKLREKLVEALRAGEADARLSKDLVTIRRDAPIAFDLRNARVGEPDRAHLLALFQEFGFRSLIDKLPGAGGVVAQPENTKVEKSKKKAAYRLLRSTDEVARLVEALTRTDHFVVRSSPRSDDFFSREFFGVAISWEADQAAFVVPEHLGALATILSNSKKTKIGHDLKRDLHALRARGIELAGPLEDLMVASYLLAPGSRAHELPDLVFEHFGRELPPPPAQGALLPPRVEDVYMRACEEADLIWQLRARLLTELEARSHTTLMNEIEMPLIPVLATMERYGVKIDVAYLKEMAGTMRGRLAALSKKIYKLAGEEFNINSPAQLKKILFEKLELSAAKVRKTATGELSTAAGELERLRGAHPIVDLIFEYRELSKLVSTYVEALPELVRRDTGRVHTTFNQTVTATGRLSSSNPNLQNIPIRTELGRTIRRAFIAPRGYALVSADYSQIELRIAAVIARVRRMMQAFRDGVDIHAATAAEIWNVPLEGVTKEQRRAAKAINFGIIYGIGPTSLAESAGISFAEAKEFIQRYFDVYPELREYMDQMKAMAASVGYVETMFGRRRYLPEITSGVPQVRAAAERMAINMPIQGTATGDLIKLAMLAIHAWIEKEFGMSDDADVKMIMQVHDALVFEVKNPLVSPVAKKIKDLMEHVHEFTVPIVVDIEAGRSWGEQKPIEQPAP